MNKLFNHLQDMPLWLAARHLVQDANDAVEGNQRPLASKTLELAACLPAQLAYAGTSPNADIMTEVSSALKLAIQLEHHLKMINVKKPAKLLNKFKDHLIVLIEDDMNDEFDDDK